MESSFLRFKNKNRYRKRRSPLMTIGIVTLADTNSINPKIIFCADRLVTDDKGNIALPWKAVKVSSDNRLKVRENRKLTYMLPKDLPIAKITANLQYKLAPYEILDKLQIDDPALRNTVPLKECLVEAYLNGPTVYNPQHRLPEDPEIPLLLDHVYPCHEVVKVDYHLPGCPPSAETIWQAASRAGKKAILVNYPSSWLTKLDGWRSLPRVYAAMPIGQLVFYTTEHAEEPYNINWTKKGTGVNNVTLEYTTTGHVGGNWTYIIGGDHSGCEGQGQY
jgi:hypothetical protein